MPRTTDSFGDSSKLSRRSDELVIFLVLVAAVLTYVLHRARDLGWIHLGPTDDP